MNKRNANWELLTTVNPFILDNSIREPVVGNVRAQTLSDKFKVFDIVTKSGMSEVILGSFGRYPRTDDFFIETLSKKGLINHTHYIFSELYDKIISNKPAPERPKGLCVAEQHDVVNLIIEFDVCALQLKNMGGVHTLTELIELRCHQFHDRPEVRNLFFNFRDFNLGMLSRPDDILSLVSFISSLPQGVRPKGLLVEDPTGRTMPHQFGEWISWVVKQAKKTSWQDMDLLVHVHKGYGLSEAIVLESFANGATGVWAGLSETGAGVGHASSLVTLTNLARLGNTHVLESFNLRSLREAGKAIYELCTDAPIPCTSEIFSDRAFDLLLTGGFGHENELAQIFDNQLQYRMSELASPNMILERLKAISTDFQWDYLIVSFISKEMQTYLKYNQNINLDADATLIFKYICAGGDIPNSFLEAFLAQHAKYRSEERWVNLRRTLSDDSSEYILQPEFLSELVAQGAEDHWNFQLDDSSAHLLYKKLALDIKLRNELMWSLMILVIQDSFGDRLTDNELIELLAKQIIIPEFLRLYEQETTGLIEATAAFLKTDEIDHPLLYKLSKKARKDILTQAVQMNCEPGSVICRKGDLGNQFYKVIKGRFAVYSDRECQNQISELCEGSFFGELAAFREVHRLASVTAVEDSVLIAFPSPMNLLTGQEQKNFQKSIQQVLDIYTSWYQSMTLRTIGLSGFLNFIRFGTLITIPGNKQVIQKGDLPENMYFVITGSVVVDVGPNSKKKILGPGELFGEQGLFEQRYCNADVTTCEETVLCRFNSTAFQDIVAADKMFAEIIHSLIHARDLSNAANV